MVRVGTPKQIWDNTMKFEAYMRSHTDIDIYMIQVEVTETVMLVGTSDISQFYEHGFYDWVLSRGEPIQHPDEKPVLGRY